MSRSKRKRTGHKAKKEYSMAPSPKLTAVGRRKGNGHSFVCPCCVLMGFRDFKVASRRILRRTVTHKIKDEHDELSQED